MRWLGPDLSFFKELRELQASRDEASLAAWPEGQQRDVAILIGQALQMALSWPTPYFLPGDRFNPVALRSPVSESGRRRPGHGCNRDRRPAQSKDSGPLLATMLTAGHVAGRTGCCPRHAPAGGGATEEAMAAVAVTSLTTQCSGPAEPAADRERWATLLRIAGE